jgi:hypothetical protein
MKKHLNTHALIKLKKYEKPPSEYFTTLRLKIALRVGHKSIFRSFEDPHLTPPFPPPRSLSLAPPAGR